MDLYVDAEQFSLAWRAVRLASNAGKGHDQYHRACHIEWYENRGIRLVSTDTRILLWAWVPELGYQGDCPDPGRKPKRRLTVIDKMGRIPGLCIAAGNLQRMYREDSYPIYIETTTNTDAAQALFSSDVVRFHSGGDTEHVDVGIWDPPWPKWWELVAGNEEPAKKVMLHPKLLPVLGSLSSLMGDAGWELEFRGDTGAATLRAVGATLVTVEGMLVTAPVGYHDPDLGDEDPDSEGGES